jgi:hypothetical protein
VSRLTFSYVVYTALLLSLQTDLKEFVQKVLSKKSTTCDALICFLLTITHVIFMNEYVKQPFVKKTFVHGPLKCLLT